MTAEQAEQLSDRDVWVLEYGSKWEFASFFTYCAIICAYATKLPRRCVTSAIGTLQQAEKSNHRVPEVHGPLLLSAPQGRRMETDRSDRQAALLDQWPSLPRPLSDGHARMSTVRWPAPNTPHCLDLKLTLSLRFHNNWVVRPLPSHRCTFRPQNFWVLVILNVLTDGLIMTIPVPILWQLRVSKLRKVGVSLLLCSGVFVISTAVVRAAFTIAGAPSVITINRWGCKYLVTRFRATTQWFSSSFYLSVHLRPVADAIPSP